MRPLDGTTGLEAKHGIASRTCFPHGIVAQSWDGNGMAIDGALDNFSHGNGMAIVPQRAMAEGAIEGVPAEYTLACPSDTGFAHSRFLKQPTDSCAPRDVRALVLQQARRASLVDGPHAAVDRPRDEGVHVQLVEQGAAAISVRAAAQRTCSEAPWPVNGASANPGSAAGKAQDRQRADSFDSDVNRMRMARARARQLAWSR
uniref:Uncharacterized protein n=2 Tax=Calcidiscus leptoporus TaxID=127549 RepID=A0A7S0NUB7_9EUKA|mmetsp:Transcript_23657/g.54790  ORF Transcript_23657/g.54790 Transcript_23657/m.54790 type:complete len:202 (+) Transcript_23657:282-887(+)